MAVPRKEYEKGNLELLYDYHSEETKKHRRNLVVTSFIVISICYLELSLGDLTIFGLELSQGDSFKISLITFILINYWGLMFYLYYRQDWEIHSERKRAYFSHLEYLVKRKQAYDNEEEGLPVSATEWHQELNDITSTLNIYEKQNKRMSSTRRLIGLTKIFEALTPLAIYLIALWVSSKWLFT